MIYIAAVAMLATCGFEIALLFSWSRYRRMHLEERRLYMMMIAVLCAELERRGMTYISSNADLTMRQWALRHQAQCEQQLAKKVLV